MTTPHATAGTSRSPGSSTPFASMRISSFMSASLSRPREPPSADRGTPGYIPSGRVAMGAELHIGRHTARPVVLFADRADAGRALADWIDPRPDAGAVVFALPRGGIPVGRALADAL